MDDGFPDIRPQLDGELAVGNLDIAVGEVENLTEMRHIQSRREADTEAAGLEQRVILVERTAAREVEEDVALFDPDIHADIAATAGHRLGGVLTGRGPFVVLGLCT